MTVDDMLALCTPVHGWMEPEELTWLYEQAKTMPPGSAWVEVGVWKGRSFAAVACGLPDGCRLTAVDHFNGSTTERDGGHCEVKEPGRVVLKKFLDVFHHLTVVRPGLPLFLFVESSSLVASCVGDGSLDAVFIDAGHEEPEVRADLEAWLPKVKPGGLVAGHDRGYPGVQKALDALAPDRLEGPGSIWYGRQADACSVL